MTAPVAFWFDYSCPYAYLASTRIAHAERLTGQPVDYRPMLLGGVFRARGTAQNLMNELSPAKASHNFLDMNRWAEVFGVPLRMPPTHPMRTVEALRATLVAGIDRKVVDGFFHAYWVDNRDMTDRATWRDVLTAAGHDAEAVLARIDGDAVKEDLRTRTDEAIRLGIFGAPAFVAGHELYWGQDRMHFAFGRSPKDIYSLGEGSMGKHTLEVYFDFSSPFAYLGSTQAEAVAQRTGATLVWRPMLLGGVFKTLGQVDIPLASWSQAKQRYYYQDMLRWAAYWHVPFHFSSHFPMNTVKTLRCYLALPPEKRDAFREKAFRAAWAEDRNVTDEAVLRELLGEDADAVLAKTNDPAIKQELIAATQHAVDAGVFGAPTWVVDGKELFWGQDRVMLVERALSA
ncbi:MAG TPA: 2-hydroxychromene-2-carboxylate isomerase [Polyangiaceae bacterium]